VDDILGFGQAQFANLPEDHDTIFCCIRFAQKSNQRLCAFVRKSGVAARLKAAQEAVPAAEPTGENQADGRKKKNKKKRKAERD
jgi:hypothetical protein